MENKLSLVKTNESFLRHLHDAKLAQRKKLLKSANKEEIETLCECAFNILNKSVPLTPTHIAQLRKPKHRKLVYQLASRKIPISKKRKLVVAQSGGFPFALLAPIVASIIGAIAGR